MISHTDCPPPLRVAEIRNALPREQDTSQDDTPKGLGNSYDGTEDREGESRSEKRGLEKAERAVNCSLPFSMYKLFTLDRLAEGEG